MPQTTAPAAAAGSMPEVAIIADVVVVGGGPAGSAAATLLATRGRKVVLAEKDQHPRFHIGESLLPMSMPILAKLGVLDKVLSIGVRKMGADFPSTNSAGYRVFRFARSLNPTWPHAVQVRRDQFDELLFRNAAAHGVQCFENLNVSAITEAANGIIAVGKASTGQSYRIEAPYLIDATGRDTLLGKQFHLKRRHATHQSAALFAHFSGVQRRSGEDAGNISIYRNADGWIWVIPLPGDVTSIGLVCGPQTLRHRSGDSAALLWRTLREVPGLSTRLENAAVVGPLRATGNYSYRCREVTGERWLMVGDAASFVDPVFSSGVHLALQSAVEAAEAVDHVLDRPQDRAIRWRAYAKARSSGQRHIEWLILRFNTPVMRNLFANPRNDWRLEEALISLLAGDFHRDGGIHWRFRVFQGIYLLACIASPLQAVRGLVSRWGRSLQTFDSRQHGTGAQ